MPDLMREKSRRAVVIGAATAAAAASLLPTAALASPFPTQTEYRE